MKKLILTAAACAAIAAEALTVTDVTARQRWPWNNLVDVDFTINGVSGEAYYIDISATAAGGEKKLCATSFTTEPIAATGRNRIVWDLGTDYPNFKADDLSVTVTATPFSDSTPLYLVVDISGGTAAAKWPVRYTTTAPTHTAGVNDPCKTTELWLKRVKAGTFTAGNGDGLSNRYSQHICTLTQDYYLGVFSLTQAQSYNISGDYYSNFTNEDYRATRPADSVPYKSFRDPYFETTTPDVALTGGIMKNLRDRTGLKFDLPSVWQWEYACQAGTGLGRYQDATFRSSENAIPADGDENYNNDNRGDWPEEYGTSYVDRYNPNPWGFYGMLGNIWEYCINCPQTIVYGETYTNPMGNSTAGTDGAHIRQRKSGSWKYTNAFCYSYINSNLHTWNFGKENEGIWHTGGRICLTIGK